MPLMALRNSTLESAPEPGAGKWGRSYSRCKCGSCGTEREGDATGAMVVVVVVVKAVWEGQYRRHPSRGRSRRCASGQCHRCGSSRARCTRQRDPVLAAPAGARASCPCPSPWTCALSNASCQPCDRASWGEVRMRVRMRVARAW